MAQTTLPEAPNSKESNDHMQQIFKPGGQPNMQPQDRWGWGEAETPTHLCCTKLMKSYKSGEASDQEREESSMLECSQRKNTDGSKPYCN